MKQRLQPLIDSVRRGIDASPVARRLFNTTVARYWLARGANRLIVEDALVQSGDLSVAATRSTIRWAAALEGKTAMPKRFRPDRRLTRADARQAALRLVEQRLADGDDPELHRQRSYLLAGGFDDPMVRTFVQRSLDDRLSRHAVAAPKHKALEVSAGFDLLCRICDVLEEAGMRPFLVSGTLLGAVREQGLLAHDYDLDLGLEPGTTTAAEVAEVLRGVDGLLFECEQWRVWGGHASGVDFDIFVHYEDRDRWWHATSTHAWWNTPFALVRHPVGGRSFWVPDDPDRYLTENYGTWRTPTAFYHKSFDTPNREYVESTEALLYLYEQILDAIDRKDRFVAESAARELAHNFGIDVRYHFANSVLLDPASDGARRPHVPPE